MGTTVDLESAVEAPSGRLTMAVLGLEGRPDGAALVMGVLGGVPGVVRVYFNRDTEMAYVEYREPEVTPGRLLSAVEQAGLSVGDVTVRSAAPGEAFPPEVLREAVEPLPDDHACCGPDKSESTAGPGAAPVSQSAASRQSGWPFRVRLGLFLAAAVLVLGPALWLIRPMSTNAMGADYSVNMSMTGFTPPNFSVPAGKPVSIQFNNVDSPFHGITNGALHQFAIDELGIDVRLDGKQSTVITLPAMEPGSYEFYCNVCCGGKVNPSMRGTIAVGGAKSAQAMEEVSQR
jgi:cytochrome c oxidase subunit 2